MQLLVPVVTSSSESFSRFKNSGTTELVVLPATNTLIPAHTTLPPSAYNSISFYTGSRGFSLYYPREKVEIFRASLRNWDQLKSTKAHIIHISDEVRNAKLNMADIYLKDHFKLSPYLYINHKDIYEEWFYEEQ